VNQAKKRGARPGGPAPKPERRNADPPLAQAEQLIRCALLDAGHAESEPLFGLSVQALVSYYWASAQLDAALTKLAKYEACELPRRDQISPIEFDLAMRALRDAFPVQVSAATQAGGHWSADAQHGRKFPNGRPSKAAGVAKKAIERLLRQHPSMGGAAAWGAIVAKPPRGWEVYDGPRRGPHGGHVWIANHGQLSRGRFENIVSEVRNVTA
jgi:hypothetical protein